MAGGWYPEDMETMSLSQAVSIHLSSRIFPPRSDLQRPAEEACQACIDQESSKVIDLGNGGCATAAEIVDGLRLTDICLSRMEEYE